MICVVLFTRIILKRIPRVGATVAVDVVITGIALVVMVIIELTRIGDGVAVIGVIAGAIMICVVLFTRIILKCISRVVAAVIINVRITGIALAVMVIIELTRIGDGVAVIGVIAGAIMICVVLFTRIILKRIPRR